MLCRLGTYATRLKRQFALVVPGNAPQGVYGRENFLCKKIGLRQPDGQMIRPTEVPSEVSGEWEWEQVLAEPDWRL